MTKLKLESPEFENESKIPRKYGYKNENVNPSLNIEGVPEGAKSLALIMDDPDAMKPAGKIWDHWVIWNISPYTKTIQEGSVPKDASEGKNDYGELGYGGPNPPDSEHTYIFELYALDVKLELPEGSTKKELKSSIKGHVMDKAVLKGTYAP